MRGDEQGRRPWARALVRWRGDDAHERRARRSVAAGPHRATPTPIWISRRTRSVLLAAAAAALVLLVYHAPTVLVLALGGGALALVLSFPVRALSRVLPEWASITLTLLLATGLLVLAIVLLVPLLVEQLGELVETAPAIAQQLGERVPSVVDWLAERGLIQESREQMLARIRHEAFEGARQFARTLLGNLGQILTRLAGLLIGLFAMVVTAVYLLADARRFRLRLLRSTPRRYRGDLHELWDAFSFTLSRYLGGLALTLFAQGALSAIALYLLGVPYALLLGAWVALTAIVPFLGAWLGAIPALLLALTVSPLTALLTGVLFLLIQQFEASVLTPRIQGEAVRVHPLIILLGVIAGGQLFGLVGVLFAVPVLAMLRVLLDFFRARLRVRRQAEPKRLPPAGGGTVVEG